MAAFKKGDAVRQVVPAPIDGVVAGFEVDQETGAVQYRVEFQDGEETRERFFAAEQIKARTGE